MPQLTLSEKNEYLKMIKQHKGERGQDYAHRCERKFATFKGGLNESWEKGDFKRAINDYKIAPFTSVKDLIDEYMTECMNYVFQPLVMAGLTEANMTEVTKSKAVTVEEMVDVCDTAEAAMKLTAHKKIAAATMEETESVRIKSLPYCAI